MKTEYNPLEQVVQHQLNPTAILGERIDMDNLPSEDDDVVTYESINSNTATPYNSNPEIEMDETSTDMAEDGETVIGNFSPS